MNKLVLATGNKGKIEELRAILHGFECISQQTLGINDADETGLSFIENALIKARHAAHESQLPALADDSGLVVPSLHGEPGIYSARYAGPKATNDDNINRLLTKLENQSSENRHAYFYCALVFMRHASDPTPIIGTGRVDGTITRHPSGQHGFGYDPVFYLPGYQCTMAELDPTTKNQISHRGLAIRMLLNQLT